MLAFWSFSCVVDVIFQVLRYFCSVAVRFLLLYCRIGLGNFFLFTKPAARANWLFPYEALLAIVVLCCETAYPSKCSKHKLSPVSNPAAAHGNSYLFYSFFLGLIYEQVKTSSKHYKTLALKPSFGTS